MPYILPGARPQFDDDVLNLAEKITSPGELNYVLTKIVHAYAAWQPQTYATFNSIVGVFHCATYEFYRRVVAPLEDARCAVNGDVFDEQTDTAGDDGNAAGQTQ